MTADGPFVLREDGEAGITRLTLNRERAYNPLSAGMIAALQEHLDAIATDRSVRVVVVAGAGRGFSAGHDLAELGAHTEDVAWQESLFAACNAMMVSLTRLPQPVIARVHGVATAAGCQLVSMCDLAVAAETARFALPGVSVGVFCSTPAVGVARSIGRKQAMEMLLTGDLVDAATALRWGLVNRVVPANALDAEVARLAGGIAARSRSVLANGKRAFYRQIEQPVAQAYGLAAAAMTADLVAPDAAEGIEAFLAKRAPRWVDEPAPEAAP